MAALLTVATVVLAGCGTAAAGTAGSSRGAGTPHRAGTPISVVASTDVWGDIAATIGGPAVAVRSLIEGPPIDPHSFLPSPRDELAVARADVVIENGGGYDDFMQHMIAASGTRATVITAVTAAGATAPPGGELNEHIWYSLPYVGRVADAIAAALRGIDPARAGEFDRNLAGLHAQLDGLAADVTRLRAAYAGRHVAITEPVPLYLLQAAGLVNVTPPEFSEAVEEGNDIPARILAEMLALVGADPSGARAAPVGSIAALVYNAQTIGPQTQRIVAAAAAAGIPEVPVTETLPPGEHYTAWMHATITNLATALGGHR